MATVRRAVDLVRTLRGQAGIRLRQPLRRLWLALPEDSLASAEGADHDALLELLRDEVNVKHVELIGDESALVERRIKPLLPVIGPRLGRDVPKVMAAARGNEVEYLPGGGVRLAGIELAAHEVEILAMPRPGTAVAHDEGLVAVIDTDIDDELRAEGDARELTRAVQDLRKQAGLELDEMIELWVGAPQAVLESLQPHMARVAEDTLAARLHHDEPPAGARGAEQQVSGGVARIALAPTGTSR